MDIKNIKEVILGLGLVGEKAGAILKDGKVNLADLPIALELLKEFQVLIDAVQGIGEIPAEIKDLNGEEITEIGLLSYNEVKKVIAAFKK